MVLPKKRTLLEGRHEGLAPEIDGVVYIDGNGMTHSLRPAGERSQARRVRHGEITGATTYDVVGHLAGESSQPSSGRPSRVSPEEAIGDDSSPGRLAITLSRSGIGTCPAD